MPSNIFTRLQEFFQNATEIGFYPSPNYDREPPLILLGFEDSDAGLWSYDKLLDMFIDDNLILTERFLLAIAYAISSCVFDSM